MAKKHLKRCATPITWNIKRKGSTFVTRPNPGPHPIKMCMPINMILTGIIKCARTTKEVRKLLYLNEVLVDGRRVKETCFPVGILDVIQLKASKQNYRIVLNKKGKLSTIEIDENNAKQKISQVTKKTVIKGGKVQLNLSDSRNIIVEKDDYKTGDSVLIELPSQKITGHFKLEKGAFVVLTSGKHIAETGIVEKIGNYAVVYKDEKGNAKTTRRKFALVLGKDKPAIKIK